MRLWITERRQFADQLAEALGKPSTAVPDQDRFQFCRQTNRGVVLNTSGPVFRMAEPEEYNPDWKKWDVEQLPIIPDVWKMVPIQERVAVLVALRGFLARDPEIICATAPTREGNALFWSILHFFGIPASKAKRLWITSETSLEAAIADLQPYEDYQSTAVAAEVRDKYDWLEGINLSRLFTERFAPSYHDQPVTIGRVQTSALKLIVDRARAVDSFTASTFYEVEFKAQLGGRTIVFAHRPTTRITDGASAMALCHSLEHANGPLQIKSTRHFQKPPRLFTLQTLQEKCHELWGWSAQKTLDHAQALYRDHKVISHPETTSTFLPEIDVSEAGKTALELAAAGLEHVPHSKGDTFKCFKAAIPEKWLNRGPELFNNAELKKQKVAHHALIPVGTSFDVAGMSDQEKALFALIARQFVAQLCADAMVVRTDITWIAPQNHEAFKAQGTIIEAEGWRALFADHELPEAADPSLRVPEIGQILPELGDDPWINVIEPVVVAQHERGPKLFTEPALLETMQNLAVVAVSDEQRKLFAKAGKIGTVAGFADLMAKLKERGYARQVGKSLTPTRLGSALVALCEEHVPQIVSLEQNAVLERLLQEVETGAMKDADAWHHIETRVRQLVTQCLAIPDMTLPGSGNSPAREGKREAPPIPVDFIPIEAPKAHNEAIKKIGGRWDPDTKFWRIPPQTDQSLITSKGWKVIQQEEKH